MNKFPLIVQTKLDELDIQQRNIFNDEFNRRKKSVLVGYLLLIPLGWHYAYVKKWGSQILCIITLWGLLLWWIIDWFRLPTIIKRYNDDLAVKIMYEYSTIFQTKQKKVTNKKENNFSQWKKNNSNLTINDYYKNKKK